MHSRAAATRWKVITSSCLLHLIAQQSCFKISQRALHPAASSHLVMPPHPAWAALPAELLQLCFSYLDIDDSHRPER